jgi:uncharacterized membrane protein
MDGFGFLILVGIFFVLVVPGMAIAALVQIGGLRLRLERLEAAANRAALRRAPDSAPAVEPEASLPPLETIQPLPPAPAEPPRPAVAPSAAAPVSADMSPQRTPSETPSPAIADAAPPRIALEERLGSRIFVWIGGLALALAGAFLVKYSIEQGWLGPEMRCFLGGVLGGILLAGGEAMSRRSQQIAQSLSAAGVAVLYASLFAAIYLYELFEPAPGFLILAGLTAFAIGLALRQGPFVGLLGLAGGFITPAIVRTDEPNAMGLFAFLFAMQLGTHVLVRRRAWWWLAPVAVAGGLIWVCLWLVEGDRQWADDMWPALFLLATAAATAWSRRSAAAPAGLRDWDAPRVFAVVMQFAVVFVMGLLVMATGHDSYGWTFFAILSAIVLAIARFQPENEAAAAFAAVVGALVLFAWPWWPFPAESVSQLALTAASIGGLFALGGFAGQWGARSPVRWALLSAIATGLYLVVAYARLNAYEGLPSWGLVSVILAALHLAAAERVARYRLTHPGYNDALGAHALAVCGLLALAIPMELEHAWIAVAWSILLPAIAWIEAKLDIPWLRRAAWVAAGLVLIRLLPGPWLYDFPPSSTPVFNWILYGYGIPFLAFGLAAWLFRQRADDLLVRVVEAGAIAIGFLLVTLEVHHSFHREAMLVGDLDFRELASFTLAWLLVAFALLQAHRGQPRLAYLWGARLITGIAAAASVIGLLLILNPLLNNDPVGEAQLFNWLIPAYALPATLLAVLAGEFDRPENRWLEAPWLRTALGILALVMGFAFLSLETRQWFQGPVLSGSYIGDAENYAYSAVWLLYGVALLVAGILRGGRALRYASMAVIMLTISKVFLLDAAGLSGLYRVASFLGLGICLIGIGYAYHRYVPSSAPEPASRA